MYKKKNIKPGQGQLKELIFINVFLFLYILYFIQFIFYTYINNIDIAYIEK